MLKMNCNAIGKYILFPKLLIWSCPQWYKAHLKYHQNPSNGLEVEICGRIDMVGHTDEWPDGQSHEET
jgi:hypothetical protein